MKIYIGTSGWQYYHWKGKFYPEDLPSKDFLRFYSKYFNTVEINANFYHFTKKSTFEKWLTQINTDTTRINADNILPGFRPDKTPGLEPDKSGKHPDNKSGGHLGKLLSNKSGNHSGNSSGRYPGNKNPRKSVDFLFSIKLHRLFTHFRKLKLNKDDKRILKETIETYKVLGKNLGPILIQLPPSLNKGLGVLEKFLKNFKNLELAIEFRHKSWLDKETYNFLKKKKVAFVISDSPRWSTDIVKTADFVYIRFHGKPKLFASKYKKEELQRYAREIKKLKPKTLFAYFNNDAEGYAAEDALEFQKLF
jgi:uncharacterized protein YecE (DUF72 family)